MKVSYAESKGFIADEKLACFCLTPLLCWVCLCWAPMVTQPLPFLLLTCGSSVSGHNWPFNFRGRGRWGLCLGKIISGGNPVPTSGHRVFFFRNVQFAPVNPIFIALGALHPIFSFDAAATVQCVILQLQLLPFWEIKCWFSGRVQFPPICAAKTICGA